MDWESGLKVAAEQGDERSQQLLTEIVNRRVTWFKRSVSSALEKAFTCFAKAADSENLYCWLAPYYQRMHAFEAGYLEGRRTALKEIKKHTNKWYDQKTFVIKTSDIERVRLLLETFGLIFKPEQHGTGPLHYSAICEDLVLEIYPIIVDEDDND